MDKPKTRSAKKITDTVKKIVGMRPVNVKADAPKVEAEKKPVAPVKQDDFLRRVQEKAYELYANRGYTHGDDVADWYEAERLVRAGMKSGR